MKTTNVAIFPCNDYSVDNLKEALLNILEPFNFKSMIKPGMKIAIKANLVSCMTPEEAATTHPAVICELVKIILSMGAQVIVGDSPGGMYTAQYLKRVYEVTGMTEIEKIGGKLNHNFEVRTVDNPDGMVLKNFTYTAWLDECDAIIDICKLKTHGMIGMSAAAKNMFGVVPGVTKPEYHYRFPNLTDFSRMIIDLDEYFKPIISICDAVEGMEGNGPTKGTPRHIGLLLASDNPHALDLVCADIIGLETNNIPTLQAALERNLIPDDVTKLNINFDYSKFKIDDYNNIAVKSSMLFDKNNPLTRKILSSMLSTKPKLHRSECIGCGKCTKMCPAKAIEINTNKKAIINRSLCIRCFCCQEFCPTGAMKVYRPIVARILNKK